jgi:hypothetical protein
MARVPETNSDNAFFQTDAVDRAVHRAVHRTGRFIALPYMQAARAVCLPSLKL